MRSPIFSSFPASAGAYLCRLHLLDILFLISFLLHFSSFFPLCMTFPSLKKILSSDLFSLLCFSSVSPSCLPPHPPQGDLSVILVAAFFNCWRPGAVGIAMNCEDGFLQWWEGTDWAASAAEQCAIQGWHVLSACTDCWWWSLFGHFVQAWEETVPFREGFQVP